MGWSGRTSVWAREKGESGSRARDPTRAQRVQHLPVAAALRVACKVDASRQRVSWGQRGGARTGMQRAGVQCEGRASSPSAVQCAEVDRQRAQ